MKMRLGDILLAHGAVDALQLQAALAFQRQWGVPLGQVVVDQRFCEPRQVLAALAEQSGVPAVDLDAQTLNPALARLISVKVAEAHRVVPLRLEGARHEVLVVAIAAPASLASLDAVKSVSGKTRVVPRLATDAAIQRAIGRLYRGEAEQAVEHPALQGFSLPEMGDDDALPMMVHCMAEDVLPPTRPAPAPRPAPVAAASVELPGFEPLEFESTPAPKPAAPRPVAPAPAPRAAVPAGAQALPRPQASVLIYGWGAEAATGLMKLLSGAGVLAKVANTLEVLAAAEGAVVLAPLPSLEALGQRPRAQLLVAGKAPERDMPRAQALGARGFLAAPLDADLMLRAVRRLLRPESLGQRVN